MLGVNLIVSVPKVSFLLCSLWNFDEHFCLLKSLDLLYLVFIHSYSVQSVNKSFEIVDMTNFVENSLSMHFKDFYKYKIVLYTK